MTYLLKRYSFNQWKAMVYRQVADKRCSIMGLIVCMQLLILTKVWRQEAFTPMMSDSEPETPPVDIVYTWVNGTDPKLLESIEFHVAKLKQANISVEFQVKIVNPHKEKL